MLLKKLYASNYFPKNHGYHVNSDNKEKIMTIKNNNNRRSANGRVMTTTTMMMEVTLLIRGVVSLKRSSIRTSSRLVGLMVVVMRW